MLTAAAIMSKDSTTIRQDATIKDAIDAMLASQTGGLPVTDENGHLVGIVTEFALLAMAYDQDVRRHKVAQHMTRDVICVDANAPLNRVADLCILHRVRQLPVMRNEQLIGMISRRDILQALCESAPPVCTA